MLSFIGDLSDSTIENVLIIFAYLFAILLALSLHEYAHAKVAVVQGDQTPKVQGRLSLNPLKHLDPFGFLCLLLIGFGWAKPVNVNPLKFKDYRKGFFLVSIAGILTNLFLCFISTGLLFFFQTLIFSITQEFVFYLVFFLVKFLNFFSIVNISLFIFNLLPIFPLDGFNIIQSFTSGKNRFVEFMARYGSLMLLILVGVDSIFNLNIFGNVVNFLINPIYTFWIKTILI